MQHLIRSVDKRSLWAILFGLVLLVSLGPMADLLAGPGDWPGFFHAPFYTTDVFTDPTTPAGRVGLHPEDRVVGVNQARIDRLYTEAVARGKAGGSLSLLYELGRELTLLDVEVERLGWARILEKGGPLLATALLLAGLGWRYRQQWAWLGGVGLVAATDYWLNPGWGRRSGFDPVAALELGRWVVAGAKWSAYLYWPLWTLIVGVGGWQIVGRLEPTRWRKTLWGLIAVAVVTEWAAYAYDAWKSANFNNPDYIVWHARAIFWPQWAALLGLSLTLGWQRREGWRSFALLVFVVGFVYPTTFDTTWPGPGPQWYAFGFAIAVYQLTVSRAESKSAR